MDPDDSPTSTFGASVTLTWFVAFRRLYRRIASKSISTEALCANFETRITKALADFRTFRDVHLSVRYKNISQHSIIDVILVTAKVCKGLLIPFFDTGCVVVTRNLERLLSSLQLVLEFSLACGVGLFLSIVLILKVF